MVLSILASVTIPVKPPWPLLVFNRVQEVCLRISTAAVSAEVHKMEILRKMMSDLPSIALPREFVVLESIPMMGTGKVDFRSVTKIVQERMAKEPVIKG